jgi:hypothetical protein
MDRLLLLLRRHSLLLLPPIAEPNSDHLLLQVHLGGNVGNLLRTRLGTLLKFVE